MENYKYGSSQIESTQGNIGANVQYMTNDSTATKRETYADAGPATQGEVEIETEKNNGSATTSTRYLSSGGSSR